MKSCNFHRCMSFKYPASAVNTLFLLSPSHRALIKQLKIIYFADVVLMIQASCILSQCRLHPVAGAATSAHHNTAQKRVSFEVQAYIFETGLGTFRAFSSFLWPIIILNEMTPFYGSYASHSIFFFSFSALAHAVPTASFASRVRNVHAKMCNFVCR